MEWLFNWLERFLNWLLDVLLYVPKKVFQWLMEGLSWLIQQIPVPSFFADAGTLVSQLGSDIGYFMDMFQLNAGIAIVLSAYVLRFVIRRLPIVG